MRWSLDSPNMRQPRLIQIAEDEQDMAGLMAHYLRRNGFAVEVTADGLEALNTLMQRRPDLVVLDWMLPTMSGIEICRLVKSSPLLKHTPILMVTALASTEHKLEGFRHGADDYLAKPFDMRELVARVRNLLHRSEQTAA
jgi:two-component system phosphate regulon response regulator PhoB